MNDPLTSALAHERLKPDKMEHSARQTAHLGEKARKDEEDAKQLKEDERERAKGHENIMGAPFANSVNNDECCPVVGGLYFPHIHVANPNVPQKEKIALWRKTLSGVVNGICPALPSAHNEKAEGRVLYNKVLLDTLCLTGPGIFDRMIEDPTIERNGRRFLSEYGGLHFGHFEGRQPGECPPQLLGGGGHRGCSQVCLRSFPISPDTGGTAMPSSLYGRWQVC